MLKPLLFTWFTCMGWAMGKDCVDVYRADWGARPPEEEIPIGERIYYFIHNTWTDECFTQEECEVMVRSVQDKHMDEQGWPDIKCHFLVGGDGQVYEGRGWDLQGNHGGETFDANAIGVAVIGNYTTKIPSDIALTTLSNFLDCGVKQGYLDSDYSLHGHSDAVCTTSCPGPALLAEIATWPNYNGCPPGGCC